MKKISAILIAVYLFTLMNVSASFVDVENEGNYSQAISRLVQYGILSGKGDGFFDPDGGLTRAEMAKISTIIAGLESSAASGSETSIFSDVEESNWSTGYINTAARNQIILGYPDGSFAPDKSLTYAEAITVILRLLGYSVEDLGNNWPHAYISKARELSLTEGISFGDYDTISRKDIALIADRALLSDIKGTQPPKKLIELMDYTISEECIILATSRESKNLLSDEISTTIGIYKKSDDTINDYVTKKVKLVLSRDNKVVNVIPAGQTGKDIIIQSVIGSEMAYTENGRIGSMKLSDTSVVYYQGAKKTFQEVKSVIETGMTMAVYYSQDGAYDYAVIKDFEMIGPIIIYSAFNGSETAIGNHALKAEGLRVIRDGFEAKLSDIQAFDVVYYNYISNILYVYCDKVSGVYEKALPSKASVTKIILSGTEYELETQSAAQLLGEYPGSYGINDYITLLLGKDGKVAGVVDINATDLSVYGIILSGGSRISEDEDKKGTSEYYVNVFTVNATNQTFITDRDYNEFRGRTVKYTFKGGLMIPQLMPTVKLSGKIDAENKTIGGYKLTKDAKLIDLAYAPAINESGEAQVKPINLSDITVDNLTESNVSSFLKDTKTGEIQFIVFNNITLSRYSFGILRKKTNSECVLVIDGKESSYRGKFSPDEGQAIMANIQNNSLVELKALAELPVKGSLEAVDVRSIRIGTNDYPLSRDVSIYLYKDFNYQSVSLSNLSSYKIKSIRLFADKLPSKGGLVRVITFTD